MKILSIETSCDETAISLIEADGKLESPTFKILGNALSSQMNVHKEYGGVYPMLAKRKHAENLVPILIDVLKQSSMFSKMDNTEENVDWDDIQKLLSKEAGLFEVFKSNLEQIKKPNIDLISVTYGPGLAPALWVGIVFAQALSKIWGVPVTPTNHMEGHIASILLENIDSRKVNFPALALLISGGHTELVEIISWGNYNIIGETKDDAVGEAFDKVARMLGLPYPGGPEISKLAEFARVKNLPQKARFPRPMLHSKDLNFSFSGLKTSVLYYIRDNFNIDVKTQQTTTRGLSGDNNIPYESKADIAREFENSIVDVLLTKTKEALSETGAQTLIIAGGVIANKKLREVFTELGTEHPGLAVKVPSSLLATDNALMIAAATYINVLNNPSILYNTDKITAIGNLKLGKSNKR